MKIVVAGIGYIGLSNAVLLAQHNQVIAVDINEQRVKLLNNRYPPDHRRRMPGPTHWQPLQQPQLRLRRLLSAERHQAAAGQLPGRTE